jgi:lipid-A-disaccharide synthase
MADSEKIPRIFFSAGEASGDHYGAEILSGLRSAIPDLKAFGLGGAEMEAAGLERIVRAEEVAVMGITEVLRHMPRIYGEYRKLVDSVRRNRPDAAVLIDFPDVNLRLAQKLHELGVPVLYFVSPQLWAWKRRRIQRVRKYVTKMLVIFPFEEAFYRNRGVSAEFVGHPLAEAPLPAGDRDEYAARYSLDASREWIALLPGSRMRELRHNLPVMLQAAALLGERYQFLLPVASTLQPDAVRHAMRAMNAATGNSTAEVHLVPEAREALHFARASVVASGTATVQAAVIGNPFVAVYRVSGTTWALARHLVRYPAEILTAEDAFGNLPVAMANLIAAGIEPGTRAVPELLQERFTAENIVAELRPLLEDDEVRSCMMQQLAAVRAALLPTGPGNSGNSIERVCRDVLAMLGHAAAD